LSPFVFLGKNAGYFDEYSGGRSAVVDAEKFKFCVKLGVEMGAEEEGCRGVPIGLGSGRIAGEKVGEFLRADRGDPSEALALSFPT